MSVFQSLGLRKLYWIIWKARCHELWINLIYKQLSWYIPNMWIRHTLDDPPTLTHGISNSHRGNPEGLVMNAVKIQSPIGHDPGKGSWEDGMKPNRLGRNSALSLPSYMTVVKAFYLSVPQFPQLQNGNYSSYLEWLCILNELILTQCLDLCPTCCSYLVRIY